MTPSWSAGPPSWPSRSPRAPGAAMVRAPSLAMRRTRKGSEKMIEDQYEKSYVLWYSSDMAKDVLPSAEARMKLPRLIEQLAAEPDVTFELGRHRRREAVLVSAARFDEMLEREQMVSDLAWALFAQSRIEHPTSPPVSWHDAQR